MAQEEVIQILKKENKPLSRTEIADKLGMDKLRVSHAIQRLEKGNDIKIIEINRQQAMERYHCKRRMRLYYL